MKTDSMPLRYVEDGLICANGDHLKADVIVFATGFVGNMRIIVASLLGNDVASQIEDFWGLDEEGETRGAFKPSGREYFHPLLASAIWFGPNLTSFRPWTLVDRRCHRSSEIHVSFYCAADQSQDHGYSAPYILSDAWTEFEQ